MLSTSLPSITAHGIRCNTVVKKSDNVLDVPADDSSESNVSMDDPLSISIDNSLLDTDSVSDLERSTSSASRSSNRSRHQIHQVVYPEYTSKSMEAIDSEPIYNMPPTNPRPVQRPVPTPRDSPSPRSVPIPNDSPRSRLPLVVPNEPDVASSPKPGPSPLLNRAATESQTRPKSPFRSPKRQAKTMRKKSLETVIDDDVYVPMGSGEVVFNASKLGHTQSLPVAPMANVGDRVTVQFKKPVSTSSESNDEQDNYEVMHASGTFSCFSDSHARSNSLYNHHRVFSPMKGENIEEEDYVAPSNYVAPSVARAPPEGYDFPPTASRKISEEYDYPRASSRTLPYDNNHPGAQIQNSLNKDVFYEGGARKVGAPPPLPPPLPYVSDEGSGGSSGRRSPRLMQIPVVPPKPESHVPGDMRE